MEYPHEIINSIFFGFIFIQLLILKQYIAGSIMLICITIIYHAVLTQRSHESSPKEACANVRGKE